MVFLGFTRAVFLNPRYFKCKSIKNDVTQRKNLINPVSENTVV